MNTSLASHGTVPIGFRSFAEEDKPVDQSAVLNATHGPQEISFAESQAANVTANESLILQEIQNRASLGIEQEDSLENSNLPLTDGIKRKREEKRSAKKNELYLRIMKEHGLDPKAQSDANKLNYVIPPLPLHLGK